MTKDEALLLALEAFEYIEHNYMSLPAPATKAITAIKAALEVKDEPVALKPCGYESKETKMCRKCGQVHAEAIWDTTPPQQEAKDEPYAFEASMYPRVIIDPVTGNVSIGTVTKPCGLECDCTDVCEQDDYKALWQQMCERCDELDKKLAQRTWVGLTDEDYIKALELCDFDKDAAFEFFEDKLKELNT